MSKNEASITAVLGTTGSGKSAWVKSQIGKVRRLLVWDPMEEYDGIRADTMGELVKYIAAAGRRKPFRLIFRPDFDDDRRARQFDIFCSLALTTGNCTMLVEELAFVTKPSWAPARWARCTLTGRHHGLVIIGTAQRPAAIDKNFLGNATLIHTGMLTYPEDVQAVAKAAQLPEADIHGLKPLEFIEKNRKTGEITRGTIIF